MTVAFLVRPNRPLGGCLGGNATLIGAAANLTVAGVAERSGVRFRFLQYLAYGVPTTLAAIGICHIDVWLRYFLILFATTAFHCLFAIPERQPLTILR